MKLIAISNPKFIHGEAEIINNLFAEGLECIHLRKPDSSLKNMTDLIEKINPAFYDRISLHQHHILAKKFGIRKLHFTEQSRLLSNHESLQKLKHEGYIISTSVHNLYDLNTLSTSFDYTFFGPVFDSISKIGYDGIWEESFHLNKDQKKVKVIALGGIDHSNLNKIMKMNFDGAAVLGALWKNPEKATEEFARLSRSLRLGKSNGIDQLHFISNQTNDLTHLESIKSALNAGCKWIQLRIKNQLPEEVLEQAVKAKKLCEQYHAKLIINDFPFIAKEVNAYGLHLGLNDMPITEARKIVGKEMMIGGTANTFEHILLRLEDGADYIGLGPFRFTSTKQNLSPVLGLTGFEKIMIQLSALEISVPVIAIGGIVPGDIPALVAIGIHGIAMSSALIHSENRKEIITNIYKTLC